MNKPPRSVFFKKKEHKPDFIESDEYRQCARKDKYKTERVALKFVEEQLSTYGTKLRVYKCPFCKQYHVTKKVN